MDGPKLRFRGQNDLGRLVDERIATRRENLEQQHSSGHAAPAPLATGGVVGGSGGIGIPAFPEQYVETLKVTGEETGLSGDVEICPAGEIKMTQQQNPARIEVSSPLYSGSSGVQRVDDDFCCDETVVRTTGAQVIAGVKTFGSFPITPPSAPSAGFEVSNKQYVDSSIPSTYWERTGQFSISTKNNDALELSKSGASTIVAVNQTGDVSARFAVSTDGALAWGTGSGLMDVGLQRGAANRLDLADGDILRLPECLDMAEVDAAAVPTAPAGHSHWHVLTDGRGYILDAAGRRHDLAVQHKQSFLGWNVADVPTSGSKWQSTKYPGSAVAEAVITAGGVCTFDFVDGDLDAGYGRWSVEADGTSDLVQSQVAAGVPFRKFGDGPDRSSNCRAVIKARIRVSATTSLDHLYLFLCDASGNRIKVDVLSSLTSAAWTEVTLASGGTDVSSWDSALRAGIWAQGCSTIDAVDLWTLDVEWISVEQWCG